MKYTMEYKGPLNKLELFFIFFFSYRFWNLIISNNLLWLIIVIWVLFLLPIAFFFLFFMRSHQPSIKPKSPYFSFLLSYSHFFVFALDIIFISLLAPKFSQFVNEGDSLYYIKTICITLSIPIISRFFVVNKLLKILKLFINNFYSILFFRRFKASQNLRSTLLPTLGSYGEIFSVFDENLNKSEGNPVDSFYGKILSNEKEFDILNKTDWKDEVKNMIGYSGLIVFYWSETPTHSMLWELEETMRLKSMNEILFILEYPSYEKILEKYLKEVPRKNIIIFNKSKFRKNFYKFIKKKHCIKLFIKT
ncbi:hypothetical protein Q4Q35_19060 [Flavivirga aquimarina]|uniref:Uncharacterized protein n=1 Tax=Flavivirga aquimarina TaxID=2027862 RepID=A0ABT8WFZ0_9FLAO|nr:hypothetical protein [Flavivirga aquimarina]MDO5971907.1 hypothetical protein [Flavivirga aquimarina]